MGMTKVPFKIPLTPAENKSLKKKLSLNIAENIRKYREMKKMTQQEVAEKAGLHLTYLNHLEAGKYHPSTFTLWKISNVLKISIDSLTS